MNDRDLIPNLTNDVWWNPNNSDTTINIDDCDALGAGFSL